LQAVVQAGVLRKPARGKALDHLFQGGGESFACHHLFRYFVC
jgi:hypothetical protein